MSFFQQNYDKPGPGVERDTPRKTGFARIVEVLSRDFFSFWKASALLLSVVFHLQSGCGSHCLPATPLYCSLQRHWAE